MKIGSINIPLERTSFINSLFRSSKYLDILFAVCILGIISVLIFPIPTWLVDLLLCISLTLSVLILMTALFIDHPLDFSSFPTVLLVATMLRLSLNIATTRLILSNGHTGTEAAGHLIEAFGFFVMQGSVIIGAIVFGILTIINFVVITKGSGRIAEVAARFSLDAMPGKQMAIDADLSAGAINEDEARQRRKILEDENTFYGSMDGANKFVRGDAIAGILIICINFVAGILIGTVQMGMSFSEALTTYTVLTIGDGLVAQVPALIVSTAAGLLVTKSGARGSTEKAVLSQLGNYPKAMAVSSGLLVFMAMMPGIPLIPFIASATAMGLLSYQLRNKTPEQTFKEDGKTPATSDDPAAEPQLSTEEAIAQSLHIDSIKVELGYELLSLINYSKGHKLTEQIKSLRKQIAKDLGFVIPSVRIQDNLELPNNTYCIKIKEIECGRGTLQPDKFLVMNPTGGEIVIAGEPTIEPAFGLPAKWITPGLKEEAKFHEYTIVDPPTVIITHLTEVVKENITELLTYSQTQKLIENLPAENKKLATDMVPTQIPLTTLQRVLQHLLNENVSIRDLVTILEALSEVAGTTHHIGKMVEQVRTRLSKQICHANMSEKGYLPLVLLSPEWEEAFVKSLQGEGEDKHLVMPPSKLQEFVAAANTVFERVIMENEMPVLLSTPYLRPYIRSVIERFRNNIAVLSQSEINPKIKIKTLGQI